MARRSRTRITVNAIPSDIASDPLLTDFDTFGEPDLLANIQDNRLYHPLDPWTAPLAVPGRPARIQTDRYRFNSVPHESFAAPGSTLVCVRRQRRREVLFARRRTGKGGRARRRHFNFNSWVKC